MMLESKVEQPQCQDYSRAVCFWGVNALSTISCCGLAPAACSVTLEEFKVLPKYWRSACLSTTESHSAS